ncbi:MAG: NHLP bacteriocin export ABC transporter permease/ATPase subunit [Lachnospiraceae bacterium]|nr:NHLP bacteriocin export ABC transporter permease/ATPase subunit [Lachnospiraceae bacterium]
MGWFDEQIRIRKKADNEAFEDAFVEIAGAVMGKRLSDALHDERQETKDAFDEILKYYRVKSREVPDDIRDQKEVLEYLMRPYGIMRRPVKLEKGWYKDAFGPMLAVRKDNDSITALIPSGLNGYYMLDRHTGKKVRINSKNADLIDPEALAFYRPFPLKKMSIMDLLAFILKNFSYTDRAVVILLTMGVTLVGMLIPLLTEHLFDDVLVSESKTVLMAMAVFMLSVTVSRVMLNSAAKTMTARVSMKLDLTVEAATMMRVLSLPVSFFKDYSSGELSVRTRHVNSLCNMILSIGITSGLSSLFSLLYLPQIFYFAPELVVPSVTIMMLTVIVSIVTVLLQTHISRLHLEQSAKESGMGYAMISGIQKIKLSGAEKRAFARWGRLYAEGASLAYDPPTFLKINTVIRSMLSLFGTILIYYYAVESHVSMADYYAFNTCYGMVTGAFLSLSGVALSAAQIKPILQMAKPILETVPEIAEEKEVLTRITGSVELNNVSFRYNESMPFVLNKLSLKVKPGQYVAIVGKTGCGKSTLMRILLGFEKPQKGAVFYDGKNLDRIDLKSLRRKIGTVMQNGKLFQGDIFSNITISAPWLTLDDAWEAAEMAGIAEDIRHMPMGMNTIISEGQGGISGGQRQRLMIARAIAPKPRILMFDEATSALDNLTQKKVSQSLDNLKCTRIVIAHRLSTIKQCDRIIVLNEGNIIEDGTYDELIAKKGFFSDLVERQRLDVGNEKEKEE